MCDGGATAIFIASTIASTAVTAYGQVQQGKAAQASANYQAAVARNNAELERRKAEQERQRGEVEANQKRREVLRIIGAQRARIGASGVEATGSPLSVVEDSAMQGALDVATIRSNAEQRARDRLYAAQNLESQATLTQFEGASAARAGKIGALGSVLGGAARVSSPFMNGGRGQ